MMITIDQLKACSPYTKLQNLQLFTPALNNHFAAYDITTPLRAAHFLAQVIHESGSMNIVEENLNYTAALLVKVFPHYFPTLAAATPYDRQPQKIANYIYANRIGNGDTASGEGYKFRGRGLIQTTGKANYKLLAQAIATDVVEYPDLLKQPDYAVVSAMYFWKSHGLNAIADRDDILAATKVVNGGTLGLAERTANLARCKQAFGIH